MLELLHELLLRPHQELGEERPREVREHQLAPVVPDNGAVHQLGHPLATLAGLVGLALPVFLLTWFVC